MYIVTDVEVPAQRAAYRGNLSDNACKARYGVTYLRALCNQAGLPPTETSPDEDALAIDCMIAFPMGVILAQVKCTSQFKLRGKTASWPIKLHWQKNWEQLRHPVYFVMVIIDDGDPHASLTKKFISRSTLRL
jgi:hypothetical protein